MFAWLRRCICLLGVPCAWALAPVSFTPTEKAWMQQHPVIRIGIDPARTPIEYRDFEGNHAGIASSFVAILAKSTGLQFQVVPYPDWPAVIEGAKDKQVDMLTAMQPAADRREFLAFSDEYLRIPFVIVTHEDASYMDGITDLRGKRVGAVKAYHSANLLKPYADSGYFELALFADYQEAMQYVANGDLHAMVGNLAALTYEMQFHKLPLRVAAPLRLDNVSVMGVRPDWPELLSIVNKVLRSISEEERTAIKKRWVHSETDDKGVWRKVVIIFGGLFAFFLVVLALFSAWNHRLQKEVKERKLAEKRALENEHKYRMLFENMEQGFSLHEVITDEHHNPVDYTFLEVNSAFTKLTGLEPEMILGKRIRDVIPQMSLAEIERLARVALTGEPFRAEHYVERLGRWFVSWVFSPMPGRFAVVFSDITDQRKQSEKMQQHNETMSHFIYTVSHDLKSPLLTISNFINELKNDLKDGDLAGVQDDLQFITGATKRMGTLLDELRVVAQADSRKLTVTEFYFHELIHEVYQAVAGRYKNHGIAFEIVSPDHLMQGDRSRLFQVFQNLMDNAAKYMGSPLHPQVEVGFQTRVGERVYFVKDNGMGVAPENATKIFGIFEKIQAGSEGSGIGLTLVQRIVDAHKGRVWVASPGVGQGSCFYFTLYSQK